MFGLIGGGGGLNSPSVWSNYGRNTNQNRWIDPQGILPGSPEYERKNKKASSPLPYSTGEQQIGNSGVYGSAKGGVNFGSSAASGNSGGAYGRNSGGSYTGGLAGYASGNSYGDIPSWKMTDVQKYGGQGWNPYQKRAFGNVRRYAPEATDEYLRGLQGYGYGTGVRM